VPPLRERPEDVLLLFGHFRDQLAAEHGIEVPSCDTTFIQALEEYAWPGNVRQLQNFTERLLLTQPARTLTAAHFQTLLDSSRQPPLLASERASGAARAAGAPEEPMMVLPLEVELREVERRYLERALRAHRGCMQATAKAAGISRRTLLRKIKRHDLDRRDYM
jgi:DNA-binding NtrC family response regulator